MRTVSQYTKASLFFQDITDTTFAMKKEHGFTLQYFRYECSRKRNSSGMPYGPTLSSILRFTLKSLPDRHLKALYRRLKENTESSFTVVFNASFSKNNADDTVLDDYDNAMVITGTVIDINESYDSANTSRTTSPDGTVQPHDLMTTTVGFLLQSVTYIGSNNYQKRLPVNY